MNNLLQRTLSGAIFVAVVAGSITSRMLLKSRDSQVKAFSKRYLKGPE